MIRNGQAATLAATAIVSIAIGFGAATLVPADAGSPQPLIDPTAWQKTAPAPASFQPVSAAAVTPRCSEWAISDVAMEEVLDEMIRRGWRPPSQGEAIASLEDAHTIGLTAVDPNAPMPYRATWIENSSTADGVDETQADDPATAEPAPAAETPAPPPA